MTKINKPICVRSSVHVQPPSDFNHWQKELREEREFMQLMERFKTDLITAYRNRKP